MTFMPNFPAMNYSPPSCQNCDNFFNSDDNELRHAVCICSIKQHLIWNWGLRYKCVKAPNINYKHSYCDVTFCVSSPRTVLVDQWAGFTVLWTSLAEYARSAAQEVRPAFHISVMRLFYSCLLYFSLIILFSFPCFFVFLFGCIVTRESRDPILDSLIISRPSAVSTREIGLRGLERI